MQRINRGWGFVMLALAAVFMLPLVVLAQEATPEALPGVMPGGAHASLQDVAGNSVGTVMFVEGEDGKVVIEAQVSTLPPGFHGFHIHSAGVCDATAAPPFSSGGEHLNPNGSAHRDHVGDLPPLLVMRDGTGGMAVVTDRFTLADLLDADGSAVMIHELPDNVANIPERYGAPDEETLTGGDSGSPIGCGVIEQGMMQAVG